MNNTTYYASSDYVIEGDTSGISPEMERVIDSIETSFQMEDRREEESHDTFIGILGTLVIVVIFGSFIGFSVYNKVYWGKGIFPPFSRFKRVNYYDSIVYIAVRFLLCDRESYSNKLVSLSQYLKIRFPDIPGHPMDSVKAASETPVSVESTSAWLGKHLSVKEKQELFRFFGQMAISDGGLGRREHEYLSIILSKWSLDKELLKKLEDEISDRKREEASSAQFRTTRSTVNLKDKYAKILGIEINATAEEIKKAYRKLVMIHHPDKYQGNNEFEKESAKMKFIQIQEAYEYLSAQ